MFGWTSTEPVRWAMRKLFKFILKKKLGKVLLGDIDLKQLDVQLGEGVIHLSDVAFNVDCINEKLGTVSPLIMKEGSIGLLMINMPWNSKGFLVEAEEVEIVISFGSSGEFPKKDNSDELGDSAKATLDVPSKEIPPKFEASDVHEGVKTVANIVRMFLTNFQVKVRNLLVAFDPHLSNQSTGPAINRTLVFRVSEIECGACITETKSSNGQAESDNFLGLSRLTNFVKFSGGFIELLQLDSVKDLITSAKPTLGDSVSETSLSETWVIMNGLNEGVSGSLDLSIPWKNGSLDMQTLDGNVLIDPVEVSLRPSCIAWLLQNWESYQTLEGELFKVSQSLGSVYFDSSSRLSASRDFSSTCYESVPNELCFHSRSTLNGEEIPMDGLFPESNVIPNWVPHSFRRNVSADQQEVELDASMDQFFECFDEMNNSQSSLGASGMWNWTCSVFNALNFASSLASGSRIITPEKRNEHADFKAALTAIHVILYFNDENQNGDPEFEDGFSDPYHCITAECKDISICLEISPQELKFEGTVNHLELSECMSRENSLLKPCSSESSDVINTINNVLYEVHEALPPSIVVKEAQSSNGFGFSVSSHSPLGNVIKIKYLGTEGVTHCGFGRFLSCITKPGSNSLVLDLPPFMMWLNFSFINRLLNLFREIEKLHNFNSGPFCKMPESMKESPNVASGLEKVDSFKYNVIIPQARVIFCVPTNSNKFTENYASDNQFLALDVLAPSTPLKKQVEFSSLKDYASKATNVISLNVGNFKFYQISPSELTSGAVQSFSAKEISFVNNVDSFFSTFSVLWFESRPTNPWKIEKAKRLFFSDDCWDTRKFQNSDFVTVTSAKDVETLNSKLRRDIMLSSSRVAYINLGSVTIDLCSSQFAHLQKLLDVITNMFFPLENGDMSDSEETSVSQVSLFLDFQVVNIVIRPELQLDIRSSLQSELPGSWNLMKLSVQTCNLLHVSNVGGLSDSNLFWLSHGEGKLTGSTDGAPENELLLMSCLKSNRNRGDGRGSNALSSRSAGFDFFHLKDPHNLHDLTSISLGCTTSIAVGGRLDWLDVVVSFFVVPSSQTADPEDEKVKWNTSFVFKLTDFVLSYEPFYNPSCDEDARVSCLLAASSVTMSTRSVENVLGKEYNIQLRELALLLCWFHEKSSRMYSVESLQEMGYAKIARESLLELVLKTNCNNHQYWELECSKAHIDVESFHDTTTALMQLAVQLQQIYAPDLQNMIGPLQDRWNNHHLGGNESGEEAHSFVSCESNNDSEDSGSKDKSSGSVDGYCEIEQCISSKQTSRWIGDQSVPHHQSFEGPSCVDSYSPELKEGYCVSDLRPLTDVPRSDGCKDGWFDGTSLNIMENYFVPANVDPAGSNFSDGMAPDHENCGQVVGRLSFQNMKINWKMCAGSFWENKSRSNDKNSTAFMDLILSGVQIQYDFFYGGDSVSKLSLSINDIYFYDLSANAPWKLVLGHYNSKGRPRETCSKMVKFALECVRLDPLSSLEEYRGQVAVLPLLLHLQQNQLDFLIAHFGGANSDKSSETASISTHCISGHAIPLEALLPYFQKFEMWPLTLRVDYHPRSVDLAALTSGKYVELVNLVPWKGVELNLKHAEAASAYGWGAVCETIIGEWLLDISHNQVHNILRGLPTVRSLVAVGTGATKLVSLPIESYKKDRKVIKGVQRGTVAFLRNVSLEAVGLGVHLAAGVHEILSQAEILLTKIPSSGNIPKVRCNQPKDAKQGIKKAYESLSDGLGKTANALVRAPMKTYQRGGTASSVLTTAVKSVPGAAVAPVSACAGAAHYVLLGVRNSLDPEHKKESLEKYMGPNQQSD